MPTNSIKLLSRYFPMTFYIKYSKESDLFPLKCATLSKYNPNKAQKNIDREKANISALSSENLSKNVFFLQMMTS